MKDGRKSQAYRAFTGMRTKAVWARYTPEERAARLLKMRIARNAAIAAKREARIAVKREARIAAKQKENQLELELHMPQPEVEPRNTGEEEAMAALDILVQVTRGLLGVTLTRQQVVEFWAYKLK